MNENTSDPPQHRSDSHVGDARFITPLVPVSLAIFVGSLGLFSLDLLFNIQHLPPSIRSIVAPLLLYDQLLWSLVAASLVLNGGYYAVYWYVNRTDSE